MRPRIKPAALGRWTPPEDSVTWRSAWSVDPAHASVGYARALFGLALLAAALLLWILARQGEALALPEALRGSAQVMRRARSAPWTVGAALLALMTLGTTKRCFDFGR
ncbi:MAG: hypothetical protein KF901_27670, partial [Myxococcales bacterium]|nr:hypothetical protein [Myxococcales bacterium]